MVDADSESQRETQAEEGSGDYSLNDKKKKKNGNGSQAAAAIGVDSLQQAVSAFVQSSNKSKGGSKLRNDDVMHNPQPKATKKRSAHQDEDDYDDDYGADDGDMHEVDEAERDMYDRSSDSTSRRRAPDSSMYDDENDNDQGNGNSLLEDFAMKKKEYLKKKKDHYTADLKFSGIEDELNDDQDKRGVTYEIMKNKGVTPYRKTVNKNPRVKKRKAYEKAVISRKGQVRDVITGVANSYGGETTGIKSKLSRSRKFES